MIYRNFDLEEVIFSNSYGVHISAMTKEDLYSKSDIAAELAHRDNRIAELEHRLAKSLMGKIRLDIENAKLSKWIERIVAHGTPVVERVPNTPENHWIYPTVSNFNRVLKQAPKK